jgi:hypothetical protein
MHHCAGADHRQQHGARATVQVPDASGAWVYTDRQPPAGAKAETMTVDLEVKAPRMTVEQQVDGQQLNLLAINECACEAEFLLQIANAGNVSLPASAAAAVAPAARMWCCNRTRAWRC